MTATAAHPPPRLGDPSRALRRVLHAACAQLAAGAASPPWRTLLLTGSVARGESLWQRQADRWRLLGDIDLIAIIRDRDAIGCQLPHLHQALVRALERAGLQADICLSAGDISYLQRLPPSIFTFELLTAGEVLWGDRKLLAQIPRCTVAAIPAEDAWRLLNNRIVELVAALAEGAGGAAAHALAKLDLDMAASWLLFAGGYRLEARARLARVEHLFAHSPGQCPWERDSAWRERLRAATAARRPRGGGPPPAGEPASVGLASVGWRGASPSDQPGAICAAAVRQAAQDANCLWRWELTQLGHQTLAERARCRAAGTGSAAWLAAARKARGIAACARCAARSLALRTASPRYCVYAAASEWLWAYPGISPAARRAAARLPMAPPESAPPAQVAAAISANYQLWVASTRR